MNTPYEVGQQLVHHGGSTWEVQATNLPGNGQWEDGMVALAGDYRIACIADPYGRETGRILRVHADYLHGDGWRG